MLKFRISLLLIILNLFPNVNGFSEIVTVDSFVSLGDVTIAHLEQLRTRTTNAINNIESVNIKDGTIQSQDESVSISVITRYNETFNDFTVSGMLGVTDSDLTSDISTGTSYVDGNRIQLSAQAHTYTASKDTYVYIHSGGYYIFEEVANGASAPTTPNNSLLLFTAVTSGTAITTITDSRTLGISFAVASTTFPTNLRNQAYLSFDSATTMHHEPGEFTIGSTIYRRTTVTSTKSITSGTNWIEGGVPVTTAGMLVYTYGYNDSGTSWDFKYSSADPAYSDTSSNTNGTLRYYTTGGVTYRALGWVWDSADVVNSELWSNWADDGIANRIRRVRRDPWTQVSVIPFDGTLPQNTEGVHIFQVKFKPTNKHSKIKVTGGINSSSTTNADQLAVAVFIGSGADAVNAAAMEQTDGNNMNVLPVDHEYTAPNTTTQTINIRAGADTGTFGLNEKGDGTDIFVGAATSWVDVEEMP